MATRRKDVVDSTRVSTYHCNNRCVRRGFLCGIDSLTGKSYEHRREWIRNRLADLITVFAVDLQSYAIMANHLHLVITIRPDIVAQWSDDEVARRWRTLFPKKKKGKYRETTQEDIDALTSNPKLIEKYRSRLSCVSWFNRCLNEHIARRANAEDECTGRFWEGRFKCQRVIDTAAKIACCVYVDLNPIRARTAQTPERSDHTSIQDRIAAYTGASCYHRPTWRKVPLTPVEEFTENQLSTADYIMLVERTGRSIVEGKGRIPASVAPILERLGISLSEWEVAAKNLSRTFGRVIAPEAKMREAAQRAKRKWFQGLSTARRLFIKPA